MESKLTWIEPLNFRTASWQWREMWRLFALHCDFFSNLRRVCWISASCGVFAFVVLIIVRQLLPESKDELTWNCIVCTVLFCSLWWYVVFFSLFSVHAIVPKWICMSEKGVRIISLFMSLWLPRDWLQSVSFVKHGGFCLLTIRFVGNFSIAGKEIIKGKEGEMTVVVSKKVSEDKVSKFLFDSGLAHLWKV